jgi:hypothetical protein
VFWSVSSTVHRSSPPAASTFRDLYVKLAYDRPVCGDHNETGAIIGLEETQVNVSWLCERVALQVRE